MVERCFRQRVRPLLRLSAKPGDRLDIAVSGGAHDCIQIFAIRVHEDLSAGSWRWQYSQHAFCSKRHDSNIADRSPSLQRVKEGALRVERQTVPRLSDHKLR